MNIESAFVSQKKRQDLLISQLLVMIRYHRNNWNSSGFNWVYPISL